MTYGVGLFEHFTACQGMAAAQFIEISGATGSLASQINQVYQATKEMLNGTPVFVGPGQKQCLCIMSDGHWGVQSWKSKGSADCWVRVQDQTSPLNATAVWRVQSKSIGWETQSSIAGRMLNPEVRCDALPGSGC